MLGDPKMKVASLLPALHLNPRGEMGNLIEFAKSNVLQQPLQPLE